MTSRFTGRDYSTLRSEIIEFLRVRLPNNWDYTNLADPVVIFAESLARVGDQLHYTIDELRRECDVATAKRASSIYSYAMREGYKMMLPRASFGTISINTTKEQDGLLHLNLKQFDEIVVNPLGESLYVVNSDDIDADLHAPVDEDYFKSLRDYEVDESKDTASEAKRKKAMSLYQSYYEDVYNKTQHVKVVLGIKSEFPFTYNDINNDSTVELPNPLIDRDLVRLSYANSKTGKDESGAPKYVQLKYVDDVISSGFEWHSFTLTPKFIGGAVTLCIEFPTNYRDIFDSDVTTTFKFEYINIKNSKVEPLAEYEDNADAVKFPDGAITVVSGHEEDSEIAENGFQYRVKFGDGIKGYAEYENALVTRDNYKKFVQNYSALLTKDDYSNYIKALTHSYCRVYDHGDMYKIPAVLPSDANLIPRAIYILTDSNYSGREALWNDLRERSSRSDCIIMTPFGKDPYSIVIKAECYLVGTSIASVSTQIEQALTLYYSGLVGEKIPKVSMINYLVHKASDKVVRMESKIVRDSTYGTIDTTFNSVNKLDNDEIDTLFNAFGDTKVSYNAGYKSPLEDLEKSSEDHDEEYRYWLRGIIYEGPGGKFYTKEELDKKNSELSPADQISNPIKHYYRKYPQLTYAEYDSSDGIVKPAVALEYMDYPEHFPGIYYLNQANREEPINDYDRLVEHQIAYGELDSEDWDIADTAIYDKHNDAVITRVLKFTMRKSEDHLSPDWDVIGDTEINIDDTNYYCRAGSDGIIKVRKKTSDDGSKEGVIVKVVYPGEKSATPLTKTRTTAISGNLTPVSTTQSTDTIRTDYVWDSGPIVIGDDYEDKLKSDPDHYKLLKFDSELSFDGDTPPEANPTLVTEPTPVVSTEITTPVIKESYIKHHYMVPVLDKVIVLIKSINSIQ